MRVVTAADLAIFITKWMALKDDPAVSEKDASGKAWDLVMALHKLTTLGRIRAIEYCTPQGSTKTHFFYLASGARIRLDPDGSWQ